eukprot:COSAG06_NODE_45266_length_356_cov_0.797665_2_plen_63_part_01
MESVRELTSHTKARIRPFRRRRCRRHANSGLHCRRAGPMRRVTRVRGAEATLYDGEAAGCFAA